MLFKGGKGAGIFPQHWGTHGPSFLVLFLLLDSHLLVLLLGLFSFGVTNKVDGGRRESGIEDEGLPQPRFGHVARFQVPRFPSVGS